MYYIREYTRFDENKLFELIQNEGEDWKCYWGEEGKIKYQKALLNSIVYLVFEQDVLCGYARFKEDDGLGLYVYDLLVDKQYRGKEYGRLLMEAGKKAYPNQECYVLGDVPIYYEKKLGYSIEGKVYIVK